MAVMTKTALAGGDVPRTGVISVSTYQGATIAERNFWIADRRYEIEAVYITYAVAAGQAGGVMLEICRGTEAAGAGDDCMSAAFDLTATADTVQTGALLTTDAARKLNAGDRLSFTTTGNTASCTEMVLTVVLAPITMDVYK
jgi:hypothetical protein